MNCPGTQEDASFINNGFRQQQQGNGWNNQNRHQGNYSSFNSSQPSLKDLVLGQARINENLVKKLSKKDQMFFNINTKLGGLTLSVRDQLAFNKKIELKVAQLASAAKAIISPHSAENVNAVTTRGGKTTVGYFKCKQKNPQAHGYRCSFHPGVFQSIDFSQGT